MKKNYNLKAIMSKAWGIFKKSAITFSEALKLAWAWGKAQIANKAIIAAAAEAAGYADYEYHTWYGWQQLGRMVIHTSTAAFQCVIADPTCKAGVRTQSYFIYSDTQPAPIA